VPREASPPGIGGGPSSKVVEEAVFEGELVPIALIAETL